MKRTVLCVLFLALAASGCDWSQVWANAGHTNVNPIEPKFTEAAASQAERDWEAECLCTQVLTSGGLVYAVSAYGAGGTGPRSLSLRAFHATDGSRAWSFEIGNVYAAEFVAVGNGLAYATLHSENNFAVLALDAQTGALRWAQTANSNVFNPTVLDGDSLIVVNGTTPGTSFNGIASLDTNGNVEWSATTPGKVVDLVADAGHNIYVSSEVRGGSPLHTVASYITRFDASTGAASPVIQTTTRYSHLRVANGLLYFNHDDPTTTVPYTSTAVSALRLDTGAEAWNAPGEGLRAVSNTVAITTGAAGMTARNPSTGAVIWQRPGAGGEAFIAGNLLFADSIRSLTDGSVLGDVPADGDDVAFALGRIFSVVESSLEAWSLTGT